MQKKNLGKGPIKTVQEWTEEQLDYDHYERFLSVVSRGDENGKNKYKSTDPIPLEKFLELRKIYGFLGLDEGW